jgi:hypothetical protein
MSEVSLVTGATSADGERERDAVLDAAGELLATRGLIALSIEAVAGHANISATAIYRWWPSEHDLVLDTLRHEWDALATSGDHYCGHGSGSAPPGEEGPESGPRLVRNDPRLADRASLGLALESRS